MEKQEQQEPERSVENPPKNWAPMVGLLPPIQLGEVFTVTEKPFDPKMKYDNEIMHAYKAVLEKQSGNAFDPAFSASDVHRKKLEADIAAHAAQQRLLELQEAELKPQSGEKKRGRVDDDQLSSSKPTYQQ